jgi:hypothetical protein
MAQNEYQLHKYVGWADNGSHDTYYFVNTRLNCAALVSESESESEYNEHLPIEVLDRIYTRSEVDLLSSMGDQGVFSSGNGDCITIVRVETTADLVPYELQMQFKKIDL